MVVRGIHCPIKIYNPISLGQQKLRGGLKVEGGVREVPEEIIKFSSRDSRFGPDKMRFEPNEEGTVLIKRPILCLLYEFVFITGIKSQILNHIIERIF